MNDIKKLILKDENRKLEFKEILPTNDKIIKTAIALSNSQGGDLIIGVSDDKKLIGKRDGTYIRVGSSNRVATFDILEALEREKRSISFDSIINFDLKYNANIFDNFTQKINSKLKLDSNTITYEKLKLIKKEHDIYYLTNLGVWFSDKKENYFPMLKIECARFKGTTTKVFLDQATFQENIIDSIEQTISFIKRNLILVLTKGDIINLKKDAKIKRVGSTKAGYWEINQQKVAEC